jgi:hypothetical protein
MTVSTRVIKILLHHNAQPYVEVQQGLRVQVLHSMALLPRCQKHQFAAFIADRGILVVWDDQPDQIIGRVERLEAAILKTVWENALSPQSAVETDTTITPMKLDGGLDTVAEGDEKGASDAETGLTEKPRRIVLMQPILTAGTLALTIISLAAGWRQIAVEIAVDGSYMRLLFALTLIPQIWLALVGQSTCLT